MNKKINESINTENDRQAEAGSPETENKNGENRKNIKKVSFTDLKDEVNAKGKNSMSMLNDIPLKVVVELGRTVLKIKDILELGVGSIIELDKLSGEPVDILINGENIARGEVVVIDEDFGVRVTDITLDKEAYEKSETITE